MIAWASLLRHCLPATGLALLLPQNGSTAHAQDLPPATEQPAQPPPAAEASRLPRTRFSSTPAAPPRPGEPERVRMSNRPPLEESSVRGGQFHVWGRDRRHRTLLLNSATETQRLVLTALRQPSAFRHPIVIQIRDAGSLRSGASPVWSEITEVSGGFRFEINVAPERDTVPGDLWRQEVVRCLLAEMILRSRSDSNVADSESPPPDWLLHGTLEMLVYQATGRPSEAFARVFQLGHVLPLEDIFQADPIRMDSVSRSIYRASCCGLLQMLLDQPSGASSMSALLPSLASPATDPSIAIARCFPALTASGNSLSKWWALQLAAMSQPSADEILPPRDTESALLKAITLQIDQEPPTKAPAKPTRLPGKIKRIFSRQKDQPADATVMAPGEPRQLPLAKWAEIASRPDRAAILERSALALTRLSVRAHPIYRPVINDYLVLIRDLSAGRRLRDADARLALLDKTLSGIRSDLGRIEDYLDWYEATQQDQAGDAFRDYFRAEDELTSPPPRRSDPISRYLDEVAREFENQ
jgi:hypothetical protein